MGLYDGAVGRGGFASTAHVAALLGAPGACWSSTPPRRAARSPRWCTASRTLRPGGPDRRGDPQPGRLATGTRRSCATRCDEVGVPVLGVLRRADAVATPVAAPRAGAGRRAARRGARHRRRARPTLVAAGVDLDAVLALARTAPPLTRPGLGPGRRGRRPVAGPPGGRRRRWSGVHLLLRRDRRAARRGRRRGGHRRPAARRGAARRAPRALVVGGGFPEVHAARAGRQRAAARRRRRARRARRRRSPPSAPACSTSAATLDGAPMCGVLDARRAMTAAAHPRLPRRGRADRLRARAGRHPGARARVPPHRRRPRRTATARPGVARRHGGRPRASSHGRVHASYLHLHWAGRTRRPAPPARSEAAHGMRRPERAMRLDRGRRRARRSGTGHRQGGPGAARGRRGLRAGAWTGRREDEPGRAEATVRAHVRATTGCAGWSFALDDRGGMTAPPGARPGTPPPARSRRRSTAARGRSRSPPSATRTSTPPSPTWPQTRPRAACRPSRWTRCPASPPCRTWPPAAASALCEGAEPLTLLPADRRAGAVRRRARRPGHRRGVQGRRRHARGASRSCARQGRLDGRRARRRPRPARRAASARSTRPTRRRAVPVDAAGPGPPGRAGEESCDRRTGKVCVRRGRPRRGRTCSRCAAAARRSPRPTSWSGRPAWSTPTCSPTPGRTPRSSTPRELPDGGRAAALPSGPPPTG